MDFNLPRGADDGITPKEKQRQLFFLGMGFFGAIFFINLAFLLGYQYSKPHITMLCILAPVLTVGLTILDTLFLRTTCRKQFPLNPELLAKWPINVPAYPTWIYSVYLALSVVMSAYLLSRF